MKKLNKFFAVLVALAMMATLCVCMAFAQPNVEGTEQAPAQGKITKELKMPIGTTTPDADFVFEFAPQNGAPALPDLTASVDGETGTTSGDVKTVYALTEAFPDVTKFSHAGRYEYLVTEKADTYAIADATAESMDYSDAQYKVTIDVANGAQDGALYIKNVAVQQLKNDKGTTDGISETGKVDPSVPGADDTDGNGFKFANVYVKTQIEDDTDDNDTPEDPTDDTDPDQTNDGTGLYVEKIIGGNLGDKTKAFTFNVKVTAPTLAETTPAKKYQAEVVDVNDGKKVLRTIEFTSGAAQNVQLADHQRLIFNDLDVGAAFEVSETADAAYTAVVSGTGAVVDGVNTGAGRVTENQDNVTVTNTLTEEGTTPTGILISNLPYIALALVAIGGLVAYVVVRRRQDDEA